MKDLTVFDKTGKPIFTLTGDGKVMVEDGYSVKINGGETAREHNDGFSGSSSYLWLAMLLLLILSPGGSFTIGNEDLWETALDILDKSSKE